MSQVTRAESLEIWKLIADGILRREGSIDEHGEHCPAPGDQGAYDFIEKVALEIIKAELLAPNVRGAAFIKALGLGSTLNEDENAMRTALMLSNTFSPLDSDGKEIILNSTQKMQGAIKLYRGLLGYSDKNPDQETDVARKRQLTNFAKKIGINQDKK